MFIKPESSRPCLSNQSHQDHIYQTRVIKTLFVKPYFNPHSAGLVIRCWPQKYYYSALKMGSLQNQLVSRKRNLWIMIFCTPNLGIVCFIIATTPKWPKHWHWEGIYHISWIEEKPGSWCHWVIVCFIVF